MLTTWTYVRYNLGHIFRSIFIISDSHTCQKAIIDATAPIKPTATVDGRPILYPAKTNTKQLADEHPNPIIQSIFAGIFSPLFRSIFGKRCDLFSVIILHRA